MRSRLPFFAALALIVIAVLAYSWFSRLQNCLGISCISFRDKEKFLPRNIYENTGVSYRALWASGNVMARIEKYRPVTSKQALSFNQSKSMQIDGLYEEARSPYPGVLSDRIQCDVKYKPVFEEGKGSNVDLYVYSGLLNNRLQYGTCMQDELIYRSKSAMFYCVKEKTWYQIEFITRLSEQASDLTAYINSIRCD